MSEDTKKILQKFFVTLRNNVNATAIYREVWGLTQFDRESIIAQRTNTEAVDKLLDIVGNRSTRSFVSFVDALKKHDHTEIADHIVIEAKQNYPQIHRVLVTVLVVLTATVQPFSNTQSNPGGYILNNHVSTRSQNTSNGRNNQNNIRHAQNEAAATQATEDSDSENESSIFTLDTELRQIAFEYVMQWVEELSRNNQWKKLASKMKLNYQTVIDLEEAEDPVKSFFRQHCSNLTIRRFLNYLTKASLTSVLAMVRTRMGEREDNSIADNTQIAYNDSEPSSPTISSRTNIGSVSNNDTTYNITNVGTVIITQRTTESSWTETSAL